MNALQCEKCGHALAMADAQCSACGTPVPAEQRLGILLPRAEALAEQERYAEAARGLDLPLSLELPVAEKKALWRKKASWLRRATPSQEAWLDQAEAALAEALRLDDNDDLSHQVWIDLLVQRGLADKAKAWYQQRLQLNPEDAMAKRQMAVLRLAADFKTQPVVVKRDPNAGEPTNFLWKLVVPNPYKMGMMGLNAVFSLVMLLRSLASGPAGPEGAPPMADQDMATIANAASGGLADLFKSLDDPWSWGIQVILSVAYVYWGLQRRKRG